MQIIVGDIDTEYKNSGSGPVVLLLHGWGGDAFSFNPLASELRGKRLVSLSFPGFGSSQNPPIPWGVTDYAQFLQAFLEKLNISEIDTVIAHSFGGRVAIKAIATELLLPKKLILIGAAGVSQKAFSQHCMSAVIRLGKKLVAAIPLTSIRGRLKNLARHRLGSEDYRSAGGLQETFVKVVNEDLEGDARNIKTPSLLIWGDQDEQVPLSDARMLQGHIQNSQLQIIKDGGHFVFATDTKRVAGLINAFI